jgi:hypothetical protein
MIQPASLFIRLFSGIIHIFVGYQQQADYFCTMLATEESSIKFDRF